MLKVLKGSRILVDCETGDLHVDLGDGNCKPLGGDSYDLILDGFYAEGVKPVKGDFMSVIQKFDYGEPPRVLFRLDGSGIRCESSLCAVGYYDGTIYIGVLYFDGTECEPCFARYTLTEDNAFRCVMRKTFSFA